MTGIQHFQVAAFLTFVVNILLILFVVYRAPSSRIVKRFLWYGTSIAVWSFFLGLFSTVNNQNSSYLFCQALHIGAIFIPCFFLHFLHEYLGLNNAKEKKILKGAYLVSIFFLLLALFFPRLFISEVVPKLGFPFFMNAGPSYHYWVFVFFAIVIYGHILLYRGVCSADGQLRKQRKIFLIGNLVGYIGGIGVFSPVYDITLLPFPYGAYGVTLFSVMTVYASVRFRFMDIQVIIRKTLVFAGLSSFVLGIFALMTFLVRNVLNTYIAVGSTVTNLISIILVVLCYDRLREFLVNVTDKYLFQKKQEIKVILKNLSEKVSTILDLKQIGQTILSTLQEAFRLESGMIFVRDKRTEKYHLLEYFGLQPKEFANSVKTYFEKSAISGYFLSHKSTLTLDHPDSVGLPADLKNWLGMAKARVCVPLAIDEDLNGVLVLGKKKSDQEFSQEEIDYFPTIESQVSLAIQKATLLETVVEERAAKVRAEHLAKRVEFAGLIKHEIQNKLVHIEMPANATSTYCVPRLKKSFKEQDEERFFEMCDEIAKDSKKINFAANQIRIIAQTAKGGVDEKDNSVQELDCKVIWEDAKKESGLLKRCDFESKMPDGFSVCGNYHALQRVFVNLITNAYDAMKDKDEPLIKLRCSYENIEGKRVTYFEVEDSGCGISKEVREKIFENGFSTKPKPDAKDLISSGHGQGLAACKLYIESIHDGKMWVESEVSKGTTFKFWVPMMGNNNANKGS